MKGLFIPDITSEMFRNGCLESIEALMAEGEIYDIEYTPKLDNNSAKLDRKIVKCEDTMTNAEKFKQIFRLYATELWAMPEKEFLDWLNAESELEPCEDAISREQAIKLAIQLDCEARGVLKESRCRDIENRFNLLSPVTAEVSPDAIREYCYKRNLSIVDSALLAKYANGRI